MVAGLEQLVRAWTEPWMMAQVPERLEPGSPLRLSCGAVGYTTLTATLYQHTLESWADRPEDSRHAATEYRRAGIAFDHKLINATASKLNRRNLKQVFSRPLAFDAGAQQEWRTQIFELSTGLPPGFYTVAIDAAAPARDDLVTFDLVVTTVDGVAVTAPDQTVVLHVVKTEDGRAVADESLQAITTTKWGRSSWGGQLDNEGKATLPLPPLDPDESRWATAGLAAMVGDQPLSIAGVNYSFGDHGLSVDLVLDRELYRPGETVHWKLIARERADGRLVVATPAAHIGFRQYHDDDSLFEGVVTFNSFGTANGNFVIPADTRPGEVWIAVKLDGSKDVHDRSIRGFIIDNFAPPPVAAEIKLVGAPEALRPGGAAEIQVNARYFSGAPVAGARVALSINPSFAMTWSRDHSSWGQANIVEWRNQIAAQPMTAVTDARGAATFALALPNNLPPETTFGLSVEVVPDGMLASEAEGEFTVTASGYQLAEQTNRLPTAVHLGQPTVFEATVHDGQGRAVAFQGTARINALAWSEAWLNPDGQVFSGSALLAARRELGLSLTAELPEPWKNIHKSYGKTRVVEQTVTAGRDGVVRVPFAPPRAGVYQLELIDDSGRAVGQSASQTSLEHAIVVTGSDTASLPLAPGAHLFAPLRLTAGQPQEFLVVLPEGVPSGLLLIPGVDGVLTQRFEPQGQVGWVRVEHPPVQAASSVIQLWGIEHEFEPVRVEVEVVNPAQHLDIALTSKSAVTKPGAEETMTLFVRDQNRQQVRSEIALSVTDEAVNRLTDRQELKPRFLQSRSDHIPVAHSAHIGSGLLEIPDPRPGAVLNRAGHETSDDEIVHLSPFEVASEGSYGYLRSSATGAGLEVRSDGFTISGQSREFGSITVRRVFSSTAAWFPEVVTDEAGRAEVSFKYPDNLTSWRIQAYGVGANGNSFGTATAFTRTDLPFQARLQAPRFLTAGDAAQLSGVLINSTSDPLDAKASLQVEGSVALVPKEVAVRRKIKVQANAETRASWDTVATNAGEAKITLKVAADPESDGEELMVPVLPDGIWQKTAASALLKGDARSQSLKVTLPAPLDPKRVNVDLRFAAGVFPAVLDALPYLVDYPYGCVEQTVNRFLPAVVVRKALTDFGLDPARVEKRILDTEISPAAKRRRQSAGINQLDDIVSASLSRLDAAQGYNGAFGWWPGSDSPDLWMTAYVAWALDIAREAGVEAATKMRDNIMRSVRGEMDPSLGPDIRAWALAALTRGELSEKQQIILEKDLALVFDQRDQLSAHGRACLALAAANMGSRKQRGVLLRNLENGAQKSDAEGLGATVHWGLTDGFWRATDGAVETTALTLLALLKLDRSHPLVEPAANWLMLNRRSSGWSNTRDTAFAVLALCSYARDRGQNKSHDEIEVLADGKSVGRIKITPETMLDNRLSLTVSAEHLRAGKNTLELRRLKGEGAIYTLALNSAWSENETASAAGHLIHADRAFQRNRPVATVAGALRIETTPLKIDQAVEAGETLTAVVSLDVSNALEYLMVEVPKPAGCEPLNPLSGWDTQLIPVSEGKAGEGRRIYREEHDNRSVFFLDRIEAGQWEIRFGLRNRIPGKFRVAPAKIEAMYAPEVRANTTARRLVIAPRE